MNTFSVCNIVSSPKEAYYDLVKARGHSKEIAHKKGEVTKWLRLRERKPKKGFS
jgi:hypothetical protein